MVIVKDKMTELIKMKILRRNLRWTEVCQFFEECDDNTICSVVNNKTRCLQTRKQADLFHKRYFRTHKRQADGYINLWGKEREFQSMKSSRHIAKRLREILLVQDIKDF